MERRAFELVLVLLDGVFVFKPLCEGAFAFLKGEPIEAVNLHSGALGEQEGGVELGTLADERGVPEADELELFETDADFHVEVSVLHTMKDSE